VVSGNGVQGREKVSASFSAGRRYWLTSYSARLEKYCFRGDGRSPELRLGQGGGEWAENAPFLETAAAPPSKRKRRHTPGSESCTLLP